MPLHGILIDKDRDKGKLRKKIKKGKKSKNKKKQKKVKKQKDLKIKKKELGSKKWHFLPSFLWSDFFSMESIEEKIIYVSKLVCSLYTCLH